MAKGEITLVKCFGSVGSVVKDFDTKQVLAGSYLHTQTVGDKTISWKCGLVSITGVAKIVEDAFTNAEGVAVPFFRMEGLVDGADSVTKIVDAFEAVKTMAW